MRDVALVDGKPLALVPLVRDAGGAVRANLSRDEGLLELSPRPAA